MIVLVPCDDCRAMLPVDVYNAGDYMCLAWIVAAIKECGWKVASDGTCVCLRRESRVAKVDVAHD